ncbi:ABC transporter ATP-binding protein [Nocardioides sp. L-11A]|uniref:ABC transporter ATP-binding protein n=1 Tax=Nocardioides sp. L-11A TaxID=3043848 RepID=UPI00249C6428|nr:ABC transporter ATP-binding protein [Nocardioides sp. L-11A]
MSDPTQPSPPLLEVEGLTVEYRTGRSWTRVVEDVSFTLDRGETLALVGESGSGKTVSATAVLGLAGRKGGRIAEGSIRFRGRELVGLPERELRRLRGREVAMIFQNPMRSLNPAYTAGEQVAEVARVHLGLGRRAAWDKAVEMLDAVGIPEPERRSRDYPHQFSGGMAQRLAIAAALCSSPSLLIADEPTTALDVTVQARVLELLRDIQRETELAVLFISHDLGVVAEVADRVAVMYAGEVVEHGAIEELFLVPRHPYTEGLLGSIPVLGSGEPLRSIPGTIPPAGSHGEECRFAPRCAHAQPVACAVGHPGLSVAGAGRDVRCHRATDLQLEGIAR